LPTRGTSDRGTAFVSPGRRPLFPHGGAYVPGPDGRSAKYTADDDGIIRDVAQIHFEGLMRAGCVLGGVELM
jgi:hypothetical protein